jgi:arylsulfatase A-like enzyme
MCLTTCLRPLTAAALAGLLTATGLLRADCPPPARPHVVLFISDDHGWFDSPVYGNTDVRTPALERLAAAGAVFTRAFVGSPSCVPSRAVLMTGLMSARNGCVPNHAGLRPGVATLPTYLKALGYRVAQFGKSHFQPRASYADLEFVKSEVVRGPLDNDLDPAAVDRWLAGRGPADGPVCLVVGCHSPHVFWPPNDGYDPKALTAPPALVDTPQTRDYLCMYYTDITKMDRQLGAVYDSARRHLGDNTLFVYTTDNGAQWPFGKWNLYDAGIRVPFVAVWPGVVKPGRRCDALVSSVDLTPTLIELAGGTPPAGLDGRSFAGVLTGRTDAHRAEVFATHSGDGNMNVYPMRCVRTARFKYILNLHPELEYTTHIDLAPDGRNGRGYFASWEEKAKADPRAAAAVRRYHQRPREELHDVEADPHELTNLAGRPEHRPTLERLRRQTEEWMTAQGDERKLYGRPRPLPK